MKVKETSIPGLLVVETEAASDHRGLFARLFCQDELQELLGTRKIVQINYSSTQDTGAVRGLHYQQSPFAEMKFVRCLQGKVWDVAVDLRVGSHTFLRWHAEELSRNNMRMMVIPEGFAHGFQVLEENSELLYLHTAMYAKDSEGGIQPEDKMLAINWPLPVYDLSERDRTHSLLTSDFIGLIV
ncbi:MAG: dTDP-4-dehydrorhamnose 3,5-epimerase [Proteobacteria bacterium]|nr:dTDP-4-dehydrorhamnose 3,5-epimerase [Pseudomonadota bacterium]MBU1714519.1 dTDP-4-dehydrorhamnose 3,5-epimerase [Pseudomonadota bacterium]